MRSSLFIITVAAFLLLLTLATTLLVAIPWEQVFTLIAVFMALLTILSHQINLRSVNQIGRAVIIPYITSTVLKLIFSGVFLVIIVNYNQEIIKQIVIVFLLYYAAFSALEIILVSRRTRGKKL